MANSKKKCRQCKTYRPVDEMFLAPLGAFCADTDCRIEYGIANSNKAVEKARINLAKKARQEKKEKRDKEKQDRSKAQLLKRQKISWQKEVTQDVFNRMRVLEELLWYQERNLEPECISCGRRNMDWCCGHFKTRGGYPELALDRVNTSLQCNYHCNKQLSGNINGNKHSHGYIEGIKLRFGDKEGLERLDYLEKHHELLNWTWQEYESFRAECNARIRELEKLLA